MLSTVALGVIAIAMPAVAVVFFARGLAEGLWVKGLGALVIAAGLVVVVVVLGGLRGADRPVRRSSRPVAWFRRMVAGPVEASLFGTGTLVGWTSTRVDGLLADLEQPAPARPAFRPPRVPGPQVPSASAAPPPTSWPPVPSAAVAPPPTSWPPVSSAAFVPSPTSSPPVPPGRTRSARSHVVRHGETWWSVAELYLGDGGRASVLKQLNAGRSQSDGGVVDHKRPLRAGWTIDVPLAEKGGP